MILVLLSFRQAVPGKGFQDMQLQCARLSVTPSLKLGKLSKLALYTPLVCWDGN